MKNLVYGLEQPYLSQLSKGKASVVVGFGVSENAFLVSGILPGGKAKVSPLFEVAETVSGERVLSPNGKQGIFDAKENTVDFCTGDESKTLRVVKPGDVIYRKPFLEAVGDSYITNQPCWFLKQIFSEFLKTNHTKISVAFLRETKKGAYALGKNFPCDEAYFITCQKNLPHPVCFLKKEGDFVSPMEISELPAYVSQKEVSLANAYFGASGCPKTAGIALNYEELPGGQLKIKKDTVKALYSFLETRN